nr:hypothetical protein [Lelliottia aquatilis]
MTFTKEQLIKRIDKQIDINATIIERLGDDSAAASELAVDTATMDIKILDIARTALTTSERAELENYRKSPDLKSGDCLENLLWYAREASCHPDPNYACEYANLAAPGVVASFLEELQRYRSSVLVLPMEITEDEQEEAVSKEWADSFRGGWNAYRAAMLQGKAEQPQSAQQNIPEIIPSGWVLVPIEPTEDMIVEGFESEPDESFSDEKEWETYEAMSGCQQAAHRTKLCWAAMIAAAPKQCSDKSTKPVADLYAIKVPGCRSLNYTTHAGEAESCASEGWLVQEYVKVERLQRTADNGGDSYVLMDDLAFYPDKEEQQ